MTLSMFTLLVAMCVGGVLGFYVGRAYAEIFNARFQMKRTWNGRRAYRE